MSTQRMPTKPDGLQEEHLVYLDDLRESGRTNMMGARPYLVAEFDLDSRLAGEILTYWMNTFSSRKATGAQQ